MRALRLGLSVVLLQLTVLLPTAAWATGAALTFGVFASRPEAILRDRYEPLTGYLSEAIGTPVELQLLTQREMNRALASNRLDFIVTNPSHFLMIRSERSLTGVLATVMRTWKGTSTTSLGGVIVTRAGRTDISGLADIRGKSIATPGEHFLGGYQAQVLELLEVGLDIRRENRVKLVDSHDRVIRAVLYGDADVGFVRSGLLEELAESQPELTEQLQVLNEQPLTGFPFRVSTRLYPEWPVVALPHVDSRIVRRTASALFALEEDSPVAQAAGIAGFSPPADYQSVEYLARELRIAPYDRVPQVTWVDALHQYRIWVFTVLILVMLLITSTMWLAKRTRQLSIEQGRLRRLIVSWPQPMLMIQDGVFVDTNRSALELFGYASRQSLLGKDIASFSPELQPDGKISRQKMKRLVARVGSGEVSHGEWVFRRADGTRVWVDMTIAPAHDPYETVPFLLCSLYDITDRKEAEQRQRLAASVFDHAREAIFITDRYGMVVDVNDAFVSITRSSRSYAIGRPPPLPVDEGSSVFQNARSQGFWHGEFTATSGGGSPLALAMTISAVRDDIGNITHFVGIFSDVTRLKEQEQKLLTLAHYDALTGLPNRVLFADRLQQAMAQARRQDYRLAVVYIDLDEFKPINDAFGHEAGDKLLVQVAERMRLALREEDTLARLGGDEFSALVINVSDESDLESLLSRLLTAVSEPVWVSGHSVEVSASIGYTLFPQHPDLDGDQLLRQADQAMYLAKQRGKNRYCRFVPDNL